MLSHKRRRLYHFAVKQGARQGVKLSMAVPRLYWAYIDGLINEQESSDECICVSISSGHFLADICSWYDVPFIVKVRMIDICHSYTFKWNPKWKRLICKCIYVSWRDVTLREFHSRLDDNVFSAVSIEDWLPLIQLTSAVCCT